MWCVMTLLRVPRMRDRVIWSAVLACAIAVLGTGCTTTGSPPGPASSSTLASTSNPPSASGADPPDRTIELTCADAASSGLAPDRSADAAVEGLTFEGVEATGRASVQGLTPAEVGLRVPDGTRLYWIKVPVYMEPGDTSTIVELPAGTPGYLAWVPVSVWSGGGGEPIDLGPWMASRVVLHSCLHTAGTFLGGLLSTDPGMCLTLRVYQPSASAQRTEIHVGGTEQC